MLFYLSAGFVESAYNERASCYQGRALYTLKQKNQGLDSTSIFMFVDLYRNEAFCMLDKSLYLSFKSESSITDVIELLSFF